MNTVADDLESRLSIVKRLREIDEGRASRKPAPDKWSHKETMGHLVDSAANNHQRFVRLQQQEHLDLEGYNGDDWVRLQHYQDRPWLEVLALWENYNRHLVHVIRTVDSRALKHTWRCPEGKIVDLEFVIRDYIEHMQHHLDQIK
jgi:hypothetical protein